MASLSKLRRALALGMAPCLLLAAGSQAWAAAVPTVQRPDASAVQTIMKNDGWVQGTILGTDKGTTLNVDLKVVQMPVAIGPNTLVDVGPYTTDTSFLVPGNTAKVYFHLDDSGNPVADLVTIVPTVVKGNLSNIATVDGKNQVLLVQTPATASNGSGNATANVNVDVTPATKVRIIPPWDASQGLSAVTQLVAVGVSAPNGDVLAAVVIGVVSSN